MIQRSAPFKIFCGGVALFAYFGSFTYMEAKRVDAKELPALNFQDLSDGSYQGGFIYSAQVTTVNVEVSDHRIKSIATIKHLSGEKYRKAAESVVSDVLKSQTLKLPAKSGDTILDRASKKALLFAVRSALAKEALPSVDKYSLPWSIADFFFLAFAAFCLSLGAQLIGYVAFRSRNLRLARNTVAIEDITFLAGGACCGIGLVLSIM